jgi:hypothetical protein
MGGRLTACRRSRSRSRCPLGCRDRHCHLGRSDTRKRWRDHDGTVGAQWKSRRRSADLCPVQPPGWSHRRCVGHFARWVPSPDDHGRTHHDDCAHDHRPGRAHHDGGNAEPPDHGCRWRFGCRISRTSRHGSIVEHCGRRGDRTARRRPRCRSARATQRVSARTCVSPRLARAHGRNTAMGHGHPCPPA